MINASSTPSSASAPTPKVNPFQATPVGGDSSPKPFVSPMTGGSAGGSTPVMAKPKSKFNFKLWAMIGALALLIAGSVAAYVMVFQTQDVRQQASIQEPGGGDPDGTCGGQTASGQQCLSTQFVGNTKTSCINSCKCGYSGGSCGDKGIGAQCYKDENCVSGARCDGGSTGTNGTPGVCVSTTTANPACDAGWTTDSNLSCGTGQGRVQSSGQGGVQCYICRNLQSLAAGQTCTASQGCICTSGQSVGSTISNGQSCGSGTTGCWYINIPPAQSGAQPNCVYANTCNAPEGTRFASEASCNQSLQSGVIPSPATGGATACTSQQLSNNLVVSYASLNRGDNTQVVCTASGQPMYGCVSGYSFLEASGKFACISNSYPAVKRSCIASQFQVIEDFYNTAVRACGSTWSDAECRCVGTDICNTACTDPLGCSCSSQCVKTFAENHQTCGGFKANASTAPSTPGTGGSGLLCPNPPNLPAKHWVKFTCPNGCQLTTENGVTDWRCYEHRQDSSTELNLAPGECGQVDVLSGSTDDTYCGYKPENYTCRNTECHPQPSPTPPVTSMSCARMEVLDATGTTVLTQTPTVGTSVRFRCVGGGNVTPDYYFFTLRDNPTAALRLIYQGPSALTFPITITPFTHAQCNPCIGSTCSDSASVNANCNFQIGSVPTPTPPVGPQCLSLTLNNISRPAAGTTDPRIGETINFTCGEVAAANHYEFRIALPDGTTQQLTATGRNSANVVISQSGMYAAQCRICTTADATSCQEYEALPDTTASNTGAAN